MKEIDCRGLPCPQPVINTKNALDELAQGEQLLVLVDNEAALNNVTRFVNAQGHKFQVEEEASVWKIYITKSGSHKAPDVISCTTEEIPVVIVLSSRGMGSGNETLANVLLRAFLKTLKETSKKPAAIICYNQGVLLAIEDSEFVQDLKDLEKEGVKILVCGTCLDYYRVKDKLAVGQVSNMYDILETMLYARIIKP